MTLLSDIMTVPRGLAKPSKEIHEIELSGFGDGSQSGCCSVIINT